MNLYVLHYIPESLVPINTKYILVHTCTYLYVLTQTQYKLNITVYTETNMVHTSIYNDMFIQSMFIQVYTSIHSNKPSTYRYIPICTRNKTKW